MQYDAPPPTTDRGSACRERATSKRFAWLLGLCLAFGAAAVDSAPAHATTHKVAEGQSLWKIAKRYNVSVEEIAAANNINKNDPIKPGQELKIPDGKPSASKPAPKAPAATGTVHTVAKGQSLWKIASRYNVTVDEIAAANKIDKNKPIRAGQELKIPDGKAAAPTAPGQPQPPEKKPKHWVLEKPPQSTQTQKSPAERGGINPCLSQDPGMGIYEQVGGLPMGKAFVPQKGGITNSGNFDVFFHFHGHDPVRKEFVRVMDGAVLVGLSLGVGSGIYSSTFANPAVFENYMGSIEKIMAKHTGNDKAKIRKMGLIAWSAGYGAVEQILQQKAGAKVDTVILLDGLHSSYGPETLNDSQLGPWVDFAKKAKAQQRFMFVSHSSIIPHGYSSTWETASYLVWKLGGKPRTTKPRSSDPWGLELVRRYDTGNFHMRGFRGNDKADHCAHIGLLPDILKVHIKPRWGSPRGRKK